VTSYRCVLAHNAGGRARGPGQSRRNSRPPQPRSVEVRDDQLESYVCERLEPQAYVIDIYCGLLDSIEHRRNHSRPLFRAGRAGAGDDDDGEARVVASPDAIALRGERSLSSREGRSS
jgi:hypothetical protein